MKIEKGFQPSCSELVIRLKNLNKKDLLAKLEEINIYLVKVPYFYDFKNTISGKDKPVEQFIDLDNPLSPDFENNSQITYSEKYENNEPAIVAHQHCQTQLFSTLKKIADLLGSEVIAGSGGTETDYEEWLDGKKHTPKNFDSENSRRRHDNFIKEFKNKKCKKYNDKSTLFKDWTIKKLKEEAKVYHQSIYEIGVYSVSDLKNYESILKELRKRGIEAIIDLKF